MSFTIKIILTIVVVVYLHKRKYSYKNISSTDLFLDNLNVSYIKIYDIN